MLAHRRNFEKMGTTHQRMDTTLNRNYLCSQQRVAAERDKSDGLNYKVDSTRAEVGNCSSCLRRIKRQNLNGRVNKETERGGTRSKM